MQSRALEESCFCLHCGTLNAPRYKFGTFMEVVRQARERKAHIKSFTCLRLSHVDCPVLEPGFCQFGTSFARENSLCFTAIAKAITCHFFLLRQSSGFSHVFLT